jgi:hypothetical protein
MAKETATLKHRDGRTIQVEADVRRYSAGSRTTKAAIIVAVAFLLGASSIIVPGVHFIAPWLVPILGIATAVYLYKRVMIVDRVQGICPDCDKAMAIDEGGSVGNDPLYLRCPHCKTPLEFMVEQDANA